MYSLSTCWNSGRHTDGRAMLREIRDLGFEFAELSHGIRLSLLEGILAAVDAGEIRISTLHNFCPLPLGVNKPAPNLFQFSAEDRRERDSAWKHTLKTLETAARVRARLVVLHLGSLPMPGYTDRLKELVARGERNSPKYDRLCAELLERREAIKEAPFARVVEMLGRVAAEASRLGLQLGVENREALEELPLDDDFFLFFRQFTSPAIGYWHDTGHAQIKENLGFLHHAMHLESLAPQLLGFHIHDVAFPAQDHHAPGAGTVDFAALKPFVRRDHIKVFELHPATSAEDLRRGVAHIKSLWGEGAAE
ncbi:MAG: sugar phosphate isomerase/epimerase [Verrucomicrobia bacterium]|nr:sugar phosphate isomerase/epimerase [Verrucomicrobiota bacterium]